MKQIYDLNKLMKVQIKIASKVKLEDTFQKPIENVTGCDLAYFEESAVAAAVTVNYKTLQIMEKKVIVERAVFPYIPTFLSFREGPAIIKLVKGLKIKPDALMLDSHGVMHPLFCGCASYIGVIINKPTIGVAKSKLCGNYIQKLNKIGEWAPIKFHGRVVGAALLSKKCSNPIYVSVGHMVNLETAVRIVKHFLLRHKIPEPLRLAHNFANKMKREIVAGKAA